MSQNDDEIIFTDDTDDALKIGQLNVEAASIIISLQNLKTAIKNIEIHVRHYQKENIKFIRSLKKNQKTRLAKVSSIDRSNMREPSGFAKKTKVKKELADFFKRPDVANIIDIILNEEDGKENSKFETIDAEGMINRPSATKIINRYIKEKKLQNPSNKQFFVPDEALKKILSNLEAADKKIGGYRCFNLQKYIKHLFN